MTAPIVSAIAVPPTRAGRPHALRTARPMPVPSLSVRRLDAVYGLAALDSSGRITDRHVLRSLSWSPSQRLLLRLVDASVLIVADQQGTARIGDDGHLRLPVCLRRACHLIAGDRVLLVADPPSGQLLVHPPTALDALATIHPTKALSGGQP